MHFPRRLPPGLGAVGGIVICTYLLSVGATWFGVTDRTTAYLSLVVLSLLMIGWLWRRKSSPWHRSYFDEVLPMAGIALLISTAANRDALQQIGSGLWFVAGYIVVWYLLQDALANGLLRPRALADVLLLAGTVVIIPAFVEGVSNVSTASASDPMRVSGVLGNPNNLGAFVLLTIPLLVERQGETNGIARLLITIYLLIASAVLLMSDSRGAEFGLITAFLFVVSKRNRVPFVCVLLITTWIALGVFLLTLRGDSGRTGIYYNATLEFLQHVLTGTGLFTFRVHTSVTMDPGGTYLYAHNLVLHIASELGIPGLITFTSAVVALLRVRLPPDDMLRLWAYAAVLGTGVHQMVDFPLMMPALALSFLVVLTLALPPRPEPTSPRNALVVASAAVSLIVVGVLRAPLQVK